MPYDQATRRFETRRKYENPIADTAPLGSCAARNPALERDGCGGRLAQPGTGTLKVDGKGIDSKRMAKTLPIILQWDESFDVGSDTLTGVNDADYKPPFALTAKLNKLTIKVGGPQWSPADIKKLQATMTEKAKAD